MTRGPYPCQTATRVRDPRNVDGSLILPSPAVAIQFVATFSFHVVPSGMPHRGPDMSVRDMPLVVASDESVDSKRSEPLAWGLCGPLGCSGPVRPDTTAAYASPPTVGPSCRLLSAASSHVEPLSSGLIRTDDRRAGRLLPGSDEPSNLESSSALRFLTGICGPLAGCQNLTPDSALTLEARSALRVVLGGRNGLHLLASHHTLTQLPKEDWGKLKVEHGFHKC